ncbi:hypothetical protein MEQU1_003081 [Malassezia equina]|uniref:Uncharacterized protein n=1 Tax=Malassezia equina TaxID=1381935 RepID=A0AAF0IZX8_9BASI|nr:hypothetical protein MEQU1_003081 [Malassezia equina]
MPTWRVYAADRTILAPGASLAYLQDFINTEGKDGADEDRLMLSRLLVEDAPSLRMAEERAAAARCVRYLTREKITAEPWNNEQALRTLFNLQTQVDLTPSNELSLDVLRAFCNVLQYFHEQSTMLAKLYLQPLTQVVTDPAFYVSTTDPDAYTFPILLAFSFVTGDPVFQARPKTERAALLLPILKLLRTYGPPTDLPLDTWTPPKFYGTLMCAAFHVVREELDDTSDLHTLAMRAVLWEEPQAPFPVSILAASSANILAILPAPEKPDLDPGLLFDLGRKIAQLVFKLVESYVSMEGEVYEHRMMEHQVRAPLETLLLPLCGQLLRMLGTMEDLRPIVEAIFCTAERPKDAWEPEEGQATRLENLRDVEHLGLFPRTNSICGLMSSPGMPMVAMIFAYCMYSVSQENADLFVERFGMEACVGVLISEMSEDKYNELLKEEEKHKPLGQVSVYDENDEFAPEDAMPADELLARLQRLQELGIEHENPLELVSKLGLLEDIEEKIQAKQHANEARELAEAEAEVARLSLRRS